MIYSTGDSVEAILAQICNDLPRADLADAYLPELVLAGLCMRYGVPSRRILALFPGFDMTWIHHRLIETMEAPALSQWYFSNLDRFDFRFRRVMNQTLGQYRRFMSHESVNIGNPPLRIPAMPVS